jgi:hypothetical protein
MDRELLAGEGLEYGYRDQAAVPLRKLRSFPYFTVD